MNADLAAQYAQFEKWLGHPFTKKVLEFFQHDIADAGAVLVANANDPQQTAMNKARYDLKKELANGSVFRDAFNWWNRRIKAPYYAAQQSADIANRAATGQAGGADHERNGFEM